MSCSLKIQVIFFFSTLEGAKGKTTFGLEVVARKTVAVDPRFFPLGSLAYLHYLEPQFSGENVSEPYEFKEVSSFVLAHDTGGAIKGADRVDLFWGHGKEAGRAAGVIKHPARLLFLGPQNCL